MPTMDEHTIAAAEQLRLTHLESQVVDVLVAKTGMSAAQALDCWYRSDLSVSVERNDYGLQYLDANYLVDELLRRNGMGSRRHSTP